MIRLDGSVEMQRNDKTIGKEELLGLLKDEGTVIVDVLGSGSYEKEHILNSISVPLDELEKGNHTLPMDKRIVTYCASYSCGASSKAADILRRSGYDAAAYEGGIEEWRKLGLPMEGTKSNDRNR